MFNTQKIFVLSSLVICLSVSDAFAAGYTCTMPTYTSCKEDYYMTASASDYIPNNTIQVLNACRPCDVYNDNVAVGYFSCPGGTKAPTRIGDRCNPGEYLKAGENTCRECPANHYCEGGDFGMKMGMDQGAKGCDTLTTETNPVNIPDGVYSSDAGSRTPEACYYTAPSKEIDVCRSTTATQVRYSKEVGWLPVGYNVTANGGWIVVNNGKENATCTACTGATYSKGGIAEVCTSCPTPAKGWKQGESEADSPWDDVTDCYEYIDATENGCASGLKKKYSSIVATWDGKDDVTKPTAPKGSIVHHDTFSCEKCTGATFSDGGGATVCTDCPAGYDFVNNLPGKSLASQCEMKVQSGYYVQTANDQRATECPKGTYNDQSRVVNYGSTSTCTACPALAESMGDNQTAASVTTESTGSTSSAACYYVRTTTTDAGTYEEKCSMAD